MKIEIALKTMSISEAIRLNNRRLFCNADETINTIAECSMDKQIPMKPKVMDKPLKNEKYWWICGNCGANKHTNFRSNYCSYCGQRVDWTEYLENSKYEVSEYIMNHAKMVFPEIMDEVSE